MMLPPRLILALVTLDSVSFGSTLTFSNQNGQAFGNGAAIPQTCGDRVTATTDAACTYAIGAEGATPNVTVDYFSSLNPLISNSLVAWAFDYGSLVNVAYRNAGAGILFTADPGYFVSLLSLDLAGWPSTSRQMSVTVLGPDASTVLFSSGNVMAPGANFLTV
jgi:hypothetical protein